MGWDTCKPKKKSTAELRLERRRELAKKFPSDIDELIAVAAACKKKPKKLPPAPHPDDMAEFREPAIVGPCQLHVAHVKAWRAAKAAEVIIERDDEPYVDEREKKLAAARAYNKARYVPRRRKPKRC
jgi:hypothetical protein